MKIRLRDKILLNVVGYLISMMTPPTRAFVRHAYIHGIEVLWAERAAHEMGAPAPQSSYMPAHTNN